MEHLKETAGLKNETKPGDRALRKRKKKKAAKEKIWKHKKVSANMEGERSGTRNREGQDPWRY